MPTRLRYFLLREMTFGQDASFSDEAFLGRYNADLANGLGNAVVAGAGDGAPLLRREDPAASRARTTPCGITAEDVVRRYLEAMDAYEFQRALEAVWELLRRVDGYVNEKAPWAIVKAEGAASPRCSACSTTASRRCAWPR